MPARLARNTLEMLTKKVLTRRHGLTGDQQGLSFEASEEAVIGIRPKLLFHALRDNETTAVVETDQVAIKGSVVED